jgi:hypothetical protein
MQTWDEHVENHEHLRRDWLDDIALRHVAVGGGALSAEILLMLTAAETDYLYSTIAGLGDAQRGPQIGIQAVPRSVPHPFRFPH